MNDFFVAAHTYDGYFPNSDFDRLTRSKNQCHAITTAADALDTDLGSYCSKP